MVILIDSATQTYTITMITGTFIYQVGKKLYSTSKIPVLDGLWGTYIMFHYFFRQSFPMQILAIFAKKSQHRTGALLQKTQQ